MKKPWRTATVVRVCAREGRGVGGGENGTIVCAAVGAVMAPGAFAGCAFAMLYKNKDCVRV